MESVRDLNMEADDMQVVLSALKGVRKRIKEVAQTHKPLFGGEHFLTGKEVCERLYITPAPCKTIGIGGFFPTRSLQGRFSTRHRTWRICWMKTIKVPMCRMKHNGNLRVYLLSYLSERQIPFHKMVPAVFTAIKQ